MRTNKRVCAIITKGNKLLLDHRRKEGREYWVVLGGGVEEGENLEQGLTREVKEETGLDLIKNNLIDKTTDKEGTEHYFYICQLSNGVLTLGGPEGEENNKDNSHHLEWIHRNTIPKLSLYPDHLKILIDKIFD